MLSTTWVLWQQYQDKNETFPEKIKTGLVLRERGIKKIG
jgi:hypothetical protein